VSCACDDPFAVHVNGLRLPNALILAIHEGRWRRPPNARLHRVFRERPSGAQLFGLSLMRSQNLRWRAETDRAWFGERDDRLPPGDIDRHSSIILGSLGPDLPFALDYRADPDAPRVVYLHSGGDRWITVARDIEELLERLGLHR
jgi:hypothetical protein